MLASSNVNLVTSLTSFLTMGILMVNVFSTSSERQASLFVMTIALGIVVIIGIFAIGAAITRRSLHELRALEKE